MPLGPLTVALLLAVPLATFAPAVAAWVGVALAALAAATEGGRRRAVRRHALLAEVLAHVPQRCAAYGADRRLIWANAAWRQAFAPILARLGTPRPRYDDLVALAVSELPPLQRETERARRLARHLAADGRVEEDIAPDGARVRLARHALQGGGVATVAEDVTALREHETRLAESEGRMRAVLEVLRVGIWHLDAEGRTVFANPQLVALFGGRLPPGIEGCGLSLAGPADPSGPFGFPIRHEAEVILARPGAAPLRLLATASPWLVGADGGRTTVLSLQDVTPLKTAQARIEHLTEHDALTGLPNRAAFRAALEAVALDSQGGALLLLDLDRLASVNDQFGHEAGDQLLRDAARRLRQSVRPTDMVCRLGEDEFAILAFDLPAEAAPALGARLLRQLREPFVLGDREAFLTAGLGLARAPQDGDTAEALLRAAQMALEEAKAQGRGASVLFEPSLRRRREERASLRQALARGFAEKEFALHIQPQRHLGTGMLAGAEALLRWHSAALGRNVPPPELVAAAKEAGLLRDLDEWVLREGARLLGLWQGRPDAPPHLGINVTAASLLDGGFARSVADVLDGAGIAPQRLEIEIPEDLAVRDLPAVARALSALREVGVRLALDDFGSGHTNLPHLVNLPVQSLKLDRSIVSLLPDDPRAYAVTRATAALARAMQLEMVGEGVETEAQAFALRRAGFHVVQGWLVGRPVPADEFLPAAPPRQAAVR
ncbi:MAG: EAL domain-containing protein [Acetobacteraceae bacterium]|nr:EAL domain-containing protein [Acetobacteraceae bacterium]